MILLTFLLAGRLNSSHTGLNSSFSHRLLKVPQLDHENVKNLKNHLVLIAKSLKCILDASRYQFDNYNARIPKEKLCYNSPSEEKGERVIKRK